MEPEEPEELETLILREEGGRGLRYAEPTPCHERAEPPDGGRAGICLAGREGRIAASRSPCSPGMEGPSCRAEATLRLWKGP